jgi:raffinose/stachyose/melibiose transport system permease protein
MTILVVLSAMAALPPAAPQEPVTGLINFLVLTGLIIPPTVVPTIWVLEGLGLFRTMFGLILVEVAFGIAFSILLFRAFGSWVTVSSGLRRAMGAGPLLAASVRSG